MDESDGKAIHLSQRLIVAKSWWIASEIARRHPELRIIETRPYEGTGDNLCLVDPRADPGLELLRLDRLGASTATPAGRIGWNDVIAGEDPHVIVRALEERAGLAVPPSVPPTAPPVLVYRIIARVLTSLVDDRYVWTCRWGLYEPYNQNTTDADYHSALDLFPTVEAESEMEPDCFWVLEHGELPIICFDVRGRVHFMNGEIADLMSIYRSPSSSLTKTIGVALGHVLP